MQDQGSGQAREMDRRGFLGAGAGALAAAAMVGPGHASAAQPPQDAANAKATAIGRRCPSGSWARPASR